MRHFLKEEEKEISYTEARRKDRVKANSKERSYMDETGGQKDQNAEQRVD